MKEKATIHKNDIEKVYSHLHIHRTKMDHKTQETFETIAATFRWPKMFYPSLYPCKNNISSSANSVVTEK
ncbi:MAG: hypothetical protein IH620_02525 [Ignavibacterium sp.]|nr:hypothetical protein [Ignavibacterium sp.]